MKNYLFFISLLWSLTSSAQYNFYFGNLHAHTGYSDGSKDSSTSGISTPGASYSYTKKSYQMDFLGISEHNHYSSKSNPGMQLVNYAKGIYQADTANQDGDFVSLFGFEWGVISNGGHVVTHGVNDLIGWESGSGGWGPSNNYNVFCAKSDYKSYWQILKNYSNAFTTLAHPDQNDFTGLIDTANSFDKNADSMVVGLAIRSGGAFSETNDYSDNPPSLNQTEYFRALSKGYHLAPTCDHDNHFTNFGRTNKTRTVVLSQVLTRDSIIAAVKARRFYATDDWNTEVNFSVNGNVMGSTINTTNNSTIDVIVNDLDANDNVRRIDIYYGIPGSNILPTILTSITFSNTLNFTHTTIPNDRFYYFARITQIDGDLIYTAPVWINRDLSSVPVLFSDLDIKTVQTTNTLSWQFPLGMQTKEFIIEQSFNGINFTGIGKVEYSNEKVQYEFVDNSPMNGINFYRIVQLDKEGNASYSTIVTAYINKPIVTIVKLHPNPVYTQLNLSLLSDKKEEIRIRIYNQEGREMDNQTIILNAGENKYTTDVSKLVRGIYILVVSKTNQKITETQFIKL